MIQRNLFSLRCSHRTWDGSSSPSKPVSTKSKTKSVGPGIHRLGTTMKAYTAWNKRSGQSCMICNISRPSSAPYLTSRNIWRMRRPTRRIASTTKALCRNLSRSFSSRIMTRKTMVSKKTKEVSIHSGTSRVCFKKWRRSSLTGVSTRRWTRSARVSGASTIWLSLMHCSKNWRAI